MSLQTELTKLKLKPLSKISTIQVLRSPVQYMRYRVWQPVKKKKVILVQVWNE